MTYGESLKIVMTKYKLSHHQVNLIPVLKSFGIPKMPFYVIVNENIFVAVFNFFLQGIAKRLVRAAVQEAARKKEMRYKDIKRLEKGVRRHFHDDITVIVIYLDHPQGLPRQFKSNFVLNCTSAPIDIFSLNSDEAGNSFNMVP